MTKLINKDTTAIKAFNFAISTALVNTSATRVAFEAALMAYCLNVNKDELFAQIKIKANDSAIVESKKLAKRHTDNALKPARQAARAFENFKADFLAESSKAKKEAMDSDSLFDILQKRIADFCQKNGIRAHSPEGLAKFKENEEKKANEKKEKESRVATLDEKKDNESSVYLNVDKLSIFLSENMEYLTQQKSNNIDSLKKLRVALYEAIDSTSSLILKAEREAKKAA